MRVLEMEHLLGSNPSLSINAVYERQYETIITKLEARKEQLLSSERSREEVVIFK
jgi:hypothetical protein